MAFVSLFVYRLYASCATISFRINQACIDLFDYRSVTYGFVIELSCMYTKDDGKKIVILPLRPSL